jgi:metal-responsive CopG/Arc/MetJ family transcriptional regulator
VKIAISVPDDVFEEAERLVRQTRRSRSELYTMALTEYLARRAPDRMADVMDRVVSEVSDEVDEFVAEASRRILRRVEW